MTYQQVARHFQESSIDVIPYPFFSPSGGVGLDDQGFCMLYSTCGVVHIKDGMVELAPLLLRVEGEIFGNFGLGVITAFIAYKFYKEMNVNPFHGLDSNARYIVRTI